VEIAYQVGSFLSYNIEHIIYLLAHADGSNA
jgi:hypothetical protein